MKQLTTLLILIAFSIAISQLRAQQNPFIEDYLERLENSKKYLMLVAEEMPEAAYDFKASPESKTFAENLMHLGYALDWHSQSLLGGREARDWKVDTTFVVGHKSKKEMMVRIDKTFDEAMALIHQFDFTELDNKLDYLGLERTKRQIFLLLADHITHHRAQMIVLMRINGLVPPRYVLYQ